MTISIISSSNLAIGKFWSGSTNEMLDNTLGLKNYGYLEDYMLLPFNIN
jgi:hypothetical protein